jgi:3-hydroxybutyryl-CoA dehydratase
MKLKIADSFQSEYVVDNQTQELFLEISKDFNPLHMDKEYAVSKGFKAIVMHGNILNCFISHFVGEGLPHKNVVIHSQSIQYKFPVYLDDKLQFQAEVDQVIESVNAAVLKYEFKNESRDTVARGKIQIGLL